ncbi:iron ABC transporter [Skermanella stibiiresistens SB22]|uniref:Iron ABC transporter n=1 Tax=Skermanella stibiiresistens SB22 TaxID=1385369 RepID=W9GYQ6_9PROT|nr:iron ABC transporter [Skermanella stibiiresistens SB22]
MAPDLTDMTQVLFHYSALPRLTMALLCGAALALSGALLQRVLRNPIAEPTTLGISAGAQLALGTATLYAPAAMEFSREAVALAGAAAAMLLVMALSWRQGLRPVSVVLSGLIVGLTCAALSATLILLNGEYLMSLFIWGGGSLSQQGWSDVLALLPRLALAGVAAVLLMRPLILLGLDDSAARGLGVALHATRFGVLLVAVWLAASVVSLVGIIGFVGLAAPTFARLAGARSPRQVMGWAPVIGATLLWLADGVTQTVAATQADLIPTGAMTAMLGGPLLLWMLPRLHALAGPTDAGTASTGIERDARHPWRLVAVLAVALPLLCWAALTFGTGPSGWTAATGDLFTQLLPWRAPRLAAGLCAGAMLATAGTILQRLTGNPMASPEVLGISSGAGLGFAALVLAVGTPSRMEQLAASTLGAAAALAVMLLLARRSSFAPERLLLAGVALAAFCGSVLGVIMASGNTRAFQLLGWISGSTYTLETSDAVLAAAVATVLILIVPVTARWLEILPLGETTARSLGVPLGSSRLSLVVLASLLTAAATLVVGPLSFVGLMAPHLARLIGLRRPLTHLVGATLLGAFLMGLSDWLSRTLAFPYQLPVGLFATLIGGPYLMWLLARPSGSKGG